MARRTKEEAAETRQQILDMALDVFSKRGYSRTTFVDIADRIGLSKGAVYWHFKTKTDLLVALIEDSLSRKCLRLESPGKLTDSLASLRRCYVESARLVLADAQLRKFEFFINFQIEWSGDLIAEVRSRLAEIGQDPFRQYSIAIQHLQDAGVVERNIDAEKLGSLLIAAWSGMLRMVLIGIVDEQEMPYRLEYYFDSMFKDIATKELES